MLKSKLMNGKLTIGSWITIGHPSIIEIMLQSPFEWLAIDMEHSSIGLETAQQLIATIEANGATPLVRVEDNDPVMIKKVMDAGAQGVIIPMVNSEEEAMRAVASVKYPPFGKRGVGLYRAQKYGEDFDGYRKWQAENSIVIVQIEHIDAVKNIDKILAVKGIDGCFIGPYDLSASLGIPGDFGNKKVVEAMERVKQACLKAKKPLGFHVILPESGELNERIKDGYTFIAFSIDFFFLGRKCREEFAKLRLK